MVAEDHLIMLPENTVSSFALPGMYLSPDDQTSTPLVDYERGGVAVNDPSQGLWVRDWRLRLINADIVLDAPGVPAVILFSRTNVNELSLAFDQNMRPVVAFRQSENILLWWYDTTVSQHIFSDFGVGKNPRVSLDDKRQSQLSNSDVIFAYIQNNHLYYRQQRDRFLTARLLRSALDPTTKLKNIGMSNAWRLQFELV